MYNRTHLQRSYRSILFQVSGCLQHDQLAACPVAVVRHMLPGTTVQFACRSFQLLDDIVDMAQEGDGTARERLPGCLQFTLAHITSFESCILTSLGFEPVLAT